MKMKDFIDSVSKKSELSKRDSEVAVKAVINSLVELLANDDAIVLRNLGRLSVKQRGTPA